MTHIGVSQKGFPAIRVLRLLLGPSCPSTPSSWQRRARAFPRYSGGSEGGESGAKSSQENGSEAESEEGGRQASGEEARSEEGACEARGEEACDKKGACEARGPASAHNPRGRAGGGRRLDRVRQYRARGILASRPVRRNAPVRSSIAARHASAKSSIFSAPNAEGSTPIDRCPAGFPALGRLWSSFRPR
jgi:hypothetical protein